MADKNSSEGQPHGVFDTRSVERGARKKTGRVSQRRELAIVTLGMAASIAGLGGILAANPPSWAASQTAASQTATAGSTVKAAAAPKQSAPIQDKAITPFSGTNNDSSGAGETAQASAQASAQQKSERQAALRAERRAARQAARQSAAQSAGSVYSAPAQAQTQTPPAAVSQGS